MQKNQKSFIFSFILLLFISSCEFVDVRDLLPTQTSYELEGAWRKVEDPSTWVVFQNDSIFLRFEDHCYTSSPERNEPVIRYGGTYTHDEASVFVTREQGFSGEVTTQNSYSFVDPDTLIWNGVKYESFNGLAWGYTNIIQRLNNTIWYKESPLTYGENNNGEYTFYRDAWEYNEEYVLRVFQRNTTYELTDSNWVRDRVIDTFYIKQHPQDYNRPSLLSSTNKQYIDNFGFVTKTGYFLTDNPNVMYLYPSSGAGSGYSHCIDYNNPTKYIKAN